FQETGFALEEFTATTPQWTPPVACDVRAAWVSKAGEPAWRIEAAALAGRPTYFEVFGPWSSERRQSYDHFQFWRPWENTFFPFSVVVLLLGAPLAYRNWRLGRADVVGARRLTVVLLLFDVLATGVIETHFVADPAILEKLLLGVAGLVAFR